MVEINQRAAEERRPNGHVEPDNLRRQHPEIGGQEMAHLVAETVPGQLLPARRWRPDNEVIEEDDDQDQGGDETDGATSRDCVASVEADRTTPLSRGDGGAVRRARRGMPVLSG